MKQILGHAILSTVMLATNPHPVVAKEYIVKMISTGDKGNYYFEPKTLKIKSGDTVTWLNMQDEGHNVMAEKTPINADSFESPTLEKKGDKWSHVFTTAGTYTYHCHPHAPIMSAVIIVDKPSQSSQMKEIDNHAHGKEHGH